MGIEREIGRAIFAPNNPDVIPAEAKEGGYPIAVTSEGVTAIHEQFGIVIDDLFGIDGCAVTLATSGEKLADLPACFRSTNGIAATIHFLRLLAVTFPADHAARKRTTKHAIAKKRTTKTTQKDLYLITRFFRVWGNSELEKAVGTFYCDRQELENDLIDRGFSRKQATHFSWGDDSIRSKIEIVKVG